MPRHNRRKIRHTIYKSRNAENRQKEATARQAEYSKLTTEQKIEKLDFKLGKGIGAKKERERLAKAQNA